jgi:hypothetical protein
MAMHKLSSLDNDDLATFGRLVIRPKAALVLPPSAWITSRRLWTTAAGTRSAARTG